jgi:hypothetical protein
LCLKNFHSCRSVKRIILLNISGKRQ